MSILSRRSVRVATSLLAATILALSGQTTATAAGSAPQDGYQPPGHHPQLINVTMTTEGGFTLPKKVHAGLVTLRVGTPEVDSFHGLQGFYLNPGVSLRRALKDIELALSEDKATAAAGVERLTEDMTQIGGVVTTSYAPQEVTIPLDAGTYFWVDINDWFTPGITPRVHKMLVVGKFKHFNPPPFDTVVEGTTINGKSRFRAPRSLPHNARFLFMVSGHELHEAVLRPTRPGITDRYIRRFYAALKAGDPNPPPSPWVGGQSGAQSISPGRWVIMHINLPPGPYAWLCYVPSHHDGYAHVYEGMFQTVRLT